MLVDGFLDELDQAWLTVDFGHGAADFLIDTGFAGGLIIGEELFDPSQGTSAGHIDAELAAVQHYRYPTFDIEFTWFEVPIRIGVLVGPGKECLIGTYLLAPHHLDIDYEQRVVQLLRASSW